MRALFLALVFVVACAHQAPPVAPLPDVAPNGPPVAMYKLPARGPRGVVHVVSLGVRALPGADGERAAHLMVRLAAVNGSDELRWMLDPNHQLLRIAGRDVAPAFAEATPANPIGPVVILERGQRGHLDLYYRLDDTAAPTLSLRWQLARGKKPTQKVEALATELRRIEGRTAYAYYQPSDASHISAGLGMGAWWWQDHYFWQSDGCWWSYPRASFHARNPGYRPPAERVVVAGPVGPGGPSGRAPDSNFPAREGPISFWRDSSSPTQEAREREATSAWRNPPPEPASSSASSTDASSASSSPPPSSSPSSSSGKSSWRY
jgi:hypothetical protein